MSNPSFLYPYLEAQTGAIATEQQRALNLSDELKAELVDCARASWNLGIVLDNETLLANHECLDVAASLLCASAALSGRVFVLGNGGSACDADRLVRKLGNTLVARSLLDSVVVSALANDVGAARIFDRQVETFARSNDVVVVFSTSGTSANVLAAVSAARRCGAKTIAFAGYGGASLRGHCDVDVCLSVDSSSVHRIQESQGVLTNELVRRVQITQSHSPGAGA